MEITLTHNNISSTAIVPETSVLYMLSKYSDVVQDEYIITLLNYLNGSLDIFDIKNMQLFIEKILYYNIVGDIEERIAALFAKAKYTSLPCGLWVWDYLIHDKILSRGHTFFIDKKVLRDQLLENSTNIYYISMGEKHCQINQNMYVFDAPNIHIDSGISLNNYHLHILGKDCNNINIDGNIPFNKSLYNILLGAEYNGDIVTAHNIVYIFLPEHIFLLKSMMYNSDRHRFNTRLILCTGYVSFIFSDIMERVMHTVCVN